MNKFKPDMMGEYRGEIWGVVEHDYAIIRSNAFSRICEKGNFSSKSFLAWAAKQNLIQKDKEGKNTKNAKIAGAQGRCVFLKLPPELETENKQIEIPEEFIKVPEDIQKELPFN
jgi:hypothetical protein